MKLPHDCNTESTSYLLHVSEGDGLRLVAGVVPAVSRVPSGSGDPGGRLSQSVEQSHLLSQAQRAQVRFLWTWTWLLSFHHCCWFGGLKRWAVQHLLRGGGLLRGRLQAEKEERTISTGTLDKLARSMLQG